MPIRFDDTNKLIDKMVQITDDDMRLIRGVDSMSMSMRKKILADVVKYLEENPLMKFDKIEFVYNSYNGSYMLQVNFIPR